MPRKPQTTARLEAFSDGVIAVIITVMVLELKVPHQDGFAGLYAVLPTLVIYLLSYAFTAIYWMNHKHLIGRIESADHLVSYGNLGFLFFLSLLPFFTAYTVEKKMAPFPVALYAASMGVTGLSFLALRLAVQRNLQRSGELEAADRAAQRRHLGSLALYFVAVPVGYFHPYLGLMVIGGITLGWVIPDLRIGKSRIAGIHMKPPLDQAALDETAPDDKGLEQR